METRLNDTETRHLAPKATLSAALKCGKLDAAMSAQFDLPAGATLRVITSSGDVTITAEDREGLEIEAGGHAVQPRVKDGGRTVVVRAARLGSVRLQVRCPLGTDVAVGSASGDVRLVGTFGSVKATTVSGDIEMDAASDVDVRSVSGDISVASCQDRCRLHTVSGDVRVGGAGGAARAYTMSGDVNLRTSGQGDVAVKTVSGKVTIRVPQGSEPRARLHSVSGRVRCDCSQGRDFDLDCHTVSGRIEVKEP